MSTQQQAVAQTATADPFKELLSRPHTSIETYVNAASDPIKAIESFGRWIAKSGMFKLQREEAGMIVAIACIEMRIGLIEFGQTFDVMHDGRLRKKALAAQVQFENLGGKVVWIDTGDKGSGKAEVKLIYQGQDRVFQFTKEDADKAGLLRGKDSNWEKWTSEMLCARALSRGIARMCPRVYAGFDDDNDSSVTVLAPELSLAASGPTQTVAVTVQPSAVVVAQPTAAAQPVESKPSEPPAANTESSTPQPAFGISEEVAAKVMEAVQSDLIDVTDWMFDQDAKMKEKGKPGWISKEQALQHPENPFRFLTHARAQQILSNASGCLRAVREWKAKQAKG